MNSRTSTLDHVDNPSCPPTKSFEPLVRGVRSSKIQERHLDRLAIVYVRQSSPKQIIDHPESRERQYDLAAHAIALGWAANQVVVIDEDQGRSGRTADKRTGFQRLLAEVTLDHVGVVLGLEMSRLARSSKDWHHLLELCSLFGTLLGDQDGLYNPTESNDRLLLGLKGTMSEFELFTMRNRLTRGKLHKAERGELVIAVPMGYLRTQSGEVLMEPDEQARDITRLIFDRFDELGTVYAVMHDFVRNGISLGVRLRNGPRRGELVWRRPTLSRLFRVLHHPIYAGAYAYGRSKSKPTRNRASSADVSTYKQEWKVLLHNRMPAYITWERYLANQQRLQSNRAIADVPGVPRDGKALLAGILICGSCGRRLNCGYRRAHRPFYNCTRHSEMALPRSCHGLNAAAIDELVSRQVLSALEPSSLALSLQAVDDERRERQRLDRQWKQRLERAQHEAEHTERRYQAVDPENRLVARTLEQRWEESLQVWRQLQDDYDRFTASRPPQLSADERAQITALSQNIPDLWSAPETTNADRKMIIRCIVDHVVVHVDPGSNQVQAEINWQGGFVSRIQLSRSVAIYSQMQNYEEFWDRVLQLRQEGVSAAQIATRLNSEGFVPPRRYNQFTKEQVFQLLLRRGLTRPRDRVELEPHEWKLPDLAKKLGITILTMRSWAKHGWVHGRQTPTQGYWVLWADDEELGRLSRMATLSRPGHLRYPKTLTTPKRKPDE